MKTVFFYLVILLNYTGFSQNQIGQTLNGNGSTDFFGESIALSQDGNTMVVGIPSSTTFSETSVVKVYKKNGNTWELQGNVIQSGQNNLFGKSVAISSDGNIVAIGSPKEGNLGLNKGFVKVYQYDAAISYWVQIGQQLEGTFADSEFGTTVSLSQDGTVLSVGIPGDQRVKVFLRQNNLWTQIGSFIGQGSESFGEVVSLSKDGNVIALGSSTANNSTGLVRLFKKTVNTTWQQMGQDILGDNLGDSFGRSIDLNADGSIVAIGIPLSEANGIDNAGKVRVYSFNNSIWSQLGNDINGIKPYDIFGDVVSLSNDGLVLAIGTNRFDTDDKGIVNLYKFHANTWQQIGNSIIGFPLEQCGNSLAISGDGNSLAVGSIKANPTGFNYRKVVVYDFTTVLNNSNFKLNYEISIYPNPVTDVLNIEVKDVEINKIKLLSLDGKEILETSKKNINISGLSKGIYLIMIFDIDGNLSVKKIIKN